MLKLKAKLHVLGRGPVQRHGHEDLLQGDPWREVNRFQGNSGAGLQIDCLPDARSPPVILLSLELEEMGGVILCRWDGVGLWRSIRNSCRRH